MARKRDPSGEQWLTAGGRAFQLDPASPLARADWLVIADAQGQAKGARITAAAELSEHEVENELESLISKRSVIHWNKSEMRAEPRLEKRLGAITMASGPDSDPDPQALVDMLVDKCVEQLEDWLPAQLMARAGYSQIEALTQENLRNNTEAWLEPLLADRVSKGRRDLGVSQGDRVEALLGLLDWDERQALDKSAPRAFTSPAATHHTIDYEGDDAPSIEVRVQALFGLDSHPMIGSKSDAVPLLLKLTSPAGRPIQQTRDLPGFWRGSWKDVCKDMKGRYPKHRWPEEPWTEKPSLKTRNAFSKGKG